MTHFFVALHWCLVLFNRTNSLWNTTWHSIRYFHKHIFLFSPPYRRRNTHLLAFTQFTNNSRFHLFFFPFFFLWPCSPLIPVTSTRWTNICPARIQDSISLGASSKPDEQYSNATKMFIRVKTAIKIALRSLGRTWLKHLFSGLRRCFVLARSSKDQCSVTWLLNYYWRPRRAYKYGQTYTSHHAQSGF